MPHPRNEPKSPVTGTLWVVAVVAALMALMLVALVAPRVFGSEEASWIAGLVAAVVVGGGVVAYGLSKRGAGTTEVVRPEE